MDKEYIENLLEDTKQVRKNTRVGITISVIIFLFLWTLILYAGTRKQPTVKKYIDISNPQILIVRGHEYIPVQSESKTPDSCICYTLVHAEDCKNSKHGK